jgi:CRP-like cAMP-binding protein
MVSLHKNLVLSGRSFHISPKTIRGRVMSYLNSLYIKTGKLDLHIPFDRQQLADYLSVDRTALSKELSKMKKDGLIDYHKNHFVIRSSDVFDV